MYQSISSTCVNGKFKMTYDNWKTCVEGEKLTDFYRRLFDRLFDALVGLTLRRKLMFGQDLAYEVSKWSRECSSICTCALAPLVLSLGDDETGRLGSLRSLCERACWEALGRDWTEPAFDLEEVGIAVEIDAMRIALLLAIDMSLVTDVQETETLVIEQSEQEKWKGIKTVLVLYLQEKEERRELRKALDELDARELPGLDRLKKDDKASVVSVFVGELFEKGEGYRVLLSDWRKRLEDMVGFMT